MFNNSVWQVVCAVIMAFATAGCSFRSYPTLSDATVEATPAPKLPPTPTFLTDDYTTTEDTVTVRFVDVCKVAKCKYQVFKFRSDDATRRAWTDCGVDYAPRKNGDAEPDPQDPTCAFGTNSNPADLTLQVTLEQRQSSDSASGLTPTRVAIRARDEAGLVGEEASVVITHDASPPPAPANVEATAGNGTVIVTWARSNAPDVKGYKVYYGTSPITSSEWSELDGQLAANGPSPVFVPGRDVVSLALANFPNGSTIYVGVTAVDNACLVVGSTPAGDPICADNESEKTFEANTTQPHATPGEFSMREIAKYAQPTDRVARAVAVQGDLVVLVSAGTDAANPKTIVETFDLRALTTLNAALDGTSASPVHLGERVFNETSRAHCFAPAPTASGTAGLQHASKQIAIFGRYAFIASGTGYVYAVDLADPRNPQDALTNPASAATPGGCALGLDVNWPHLFIADGAAIDAAPTVDSQNFGLVDRKLVPTFATGKLGVVDTQCNDANGSPDPGGRLDTAQSIAVVAADKGEQRKVIAYVGNQGRTRVCQDTVSTPQVNFFCTTVANSCSDIAAGGSSVSDVVRLQPEMPLMLQASAQGRVVVSKDALPVQPPDGIVEQNLPVDMQGPVYALATEGRHAYAAVGGRRGVDILDLKDDSAPALIGNLFTSGDARDLVVAGPYLLVVNEPIAAIDQNVGLRVFSLAQTFVLVNSGSRQSISTVSTSGMRAFLSDPSPDVPAANFFQQPLRSLAYTPIPVQGAGGNDDQCVLVDTQRGVLACGMQNSPLPASGTRPCMTHVSGSVPVWPASCFPSNDIKAPNTVKALSHFGPELLMAYTVSTNPVFRTVPIFDQTQVNGTFKWSYHPSNDPAQGLNAYDFATDASFANGRKALPTTEVLAPGAKLPSFGRMTAIQTQSQVHVVDRQTNNTLQSFPGLFGAAFGIDDVCGVRFMNAHAYLSCLKMSDRSVTLEVDLGESECDSAAVARVGQIAAIELINTVHTSDACEGVYIVDSTATSVPPLAPPPPVVSKLALNTNYPSIAIDGENVYVSCRLPAENLCQLRIRR